MWSVFRLVLSFFLFCVFCLHGEACPLGVGLQSSSTFSSAKCESTAGLCNRQRRHVPFLFFLPGGVWMFGLALFFLKLRRQKKHLQAALHYDSPLSLSLSYTHLYTPCSLSVTHTHTHTQRLMGVRLVSHRSAESYQWSSTAVFFPQRCKLRRHQCF